VKNHIGTFVCFLKKTEQTNNLFWVKIAKGKADTYSSHDSCPICSSFFTDGNQSSWRKPVVFGRVKLEALFSHVTEVK
jgi:hypothetical protein